MLALFFFFNTLFLGEKKKKKDGENNYCLIPPIEEKKKRERKKEKKKLYLCISKCCVQTLHENIQKGLKSFLSSLYFVFILALICIVSLYMQTLTIAKTNCVAVVAHLLSPTKQEKVIYGSNQDLICPPQNVKEGQKHTPT